MLVTQQVNTGGVGEEPRVFVCVSWRHTQQVKNLKYQYAAPGPNRRVVSYHVVSVVSDRIVLRLRRCMVCILCVSCYCQLYL